MSLSQLKLKKKWEAASAGSDTFNILDVIEDQRWVLESCIRSITEKERTARALINYALKRTDQLKGELFREEESLDCDKQYRSLEFVRPSGTKEPLCYTELAAYRRKVLDYRRRLDAFEDLQLSRMRPDMYTAFLAYPISEIAACFALKAKLDCLEVIFKRFPEIQGSILRIIDLIPEGVDPRDYKSLIKLANLGNDERSHQDKDWCEDDAISELDFLDSAESLLPKSVNATDAEVNPSLGQWCIERALRIDSATGLLNHALRLLLFVHKEMGVSELGYIYNITKILCEFIYCLGDSFSVQHKVKLKSFFQVEIEDFIVGLIGKTHDMIDKNLEEHLSSLYHSVAKSLVVPYISFHKQWLSVEQDTSELLYPRPLKLRSTEEIIECIITTLLKNECSEALYSIMGLLRSDECFTLVNPAELRSISAKVFFNGDIPINLSVASNFHLLQCEGLEAYEDCVNLLKRVLPLMETLGISLPVIVMKDMFSPGSDPNELKYLLECSLESHFIHVYRCKDSCVLSSVEYFTNIANSMEQIVEIYILISANAKKQDLLPADLFLKLSLSNIDLDLAKALTTGRISPAMAKCFTKEKVEHIIFTMAIEISDSSIRCDPNDKYVKLHDFYLDLLPETPGIIAERNFLETTRLLTSKYMLPSYENQDLIMLPSQIRGDRGKRKLLYNIINSSKGMYLDVKNIIDISKNLAGLNWTPIDLTQTLALIVESAMKNEDFPMGAHLLKCLLVTCRYNMESLLKSDKRHYINSICERFSLFSAEYDSFISKAASAFIFKLPFQIEPIPWSV